MKNKKGFTLVELLAVIVILALIMGIAVVSVGSVISSSKEKTFRETAAQILNGVRQQLYISNKTAAGDYTFKSAILEKGGQSPYGAALKFGADDCTTIETGSNVCAKSASALTCNASATSFVHVVASGDKFVYTICLVDAKGNYISSSSSEENLLDQSAPVVTAAP